MNTDVLTRSIDPSRTGATLNETVLTPAAVAVRGVTILRTLAVTDDPRVEAQPLFVSNFKVKGVVRDVIYQASMGNTIYAWDAGTGALLWKTNLGTPITGSGAIDAHLINVKWGILSTPVIDRAAGTLYACAWISADKSGNWQTGQHFVAAVDLATGELKAGKPLLSLEGVTFQANPSTPKQQFRGLERKQRSGLALVNGAVIICFGTIQETNNSARGWVIAVDAASWKVAATWCSTVKGSGGGIWMSGSAPAIDKQGAIWAVTGNGDFDGSVDFGESVVKLDYKAPAAGIAGSLTLAGWWTPWTDDGRTGKNPEGETGIALRAALDAAPKASNFRIVPHLLNLGFRVEDMGDGWGDQDLGASGIVLLESLGVALVSGKDGILYTIDLADPGQTAPDSLTPANSPANYAKLAAPPILYTFYDGAINPAAPNPSAFNVLAGNVTHHLHGTPVAWPSATHGTMHFCGGENGNLRAWKMNPDKTSGYLGCSAAYASPDAVTTGNMHGGMPGWSLALSANGAVDGVVWAMIPYGDANMALTQTRILAYDAAALATFPNDGGELVPLWDSQAWNWNVLHPKFNRPIAVAGKVIVPTYDGRVLVLGLA
jgi:hypothetical protein